MISMAELPYIEEDKDMQYVTVL